MSSPFKLNVQEIIFLMDAMSPWHRKQFAELVNATFKRKKDGLRCFDKSGAEISLPEVYRRSQVDAKIRRSAYNLWMFYTR